MIKQTKRVTLHLKRSRAPLEERMHVSPTLLSGQTVQKPIGYGNELTPKAPDPDGERDDDDR